MNVGITRPNLEWFNKREVKQIKIFKRGMRYSDEHEIQVNSFFKSIPTYNIDKINTISSDNMITTIIEYRETIEVKK